MPLTLASSPILNLALVVLFGVPVIVFLWWSVDDTGVQRHLGWLSPYLPFLMPPYAATIGVVGWLFGDPHTSVLGAAAALFLLKPGYDAWRRRR